MIVKIILMMNVAYVVALVQFMNADVVKYPRVIAIVEKMLY